MALQVLAAWYNFIAKCTRWTSEAMRCQRLGGPVALARVTR